MKLYEYLNIIKSHPGIHLGKKDIHVLRIDLGGFIAFAYYNKIDISEDPNFRLFHDYIAVLYGYSNSTSGWANMLNDNYPDGKEALDKFFVHLDDFKRDLKGKNREEVIKFLENKGYKNNFCFKDHFFPKEYFHKKGIMKFLSLKFKIFR